MRERDRESDREKERVIFTGVERCRNSRNLRQKGRIQGGREVTRTR